MIERNQSVQSVSTFRELCVSRLQTLSIATLVLLGPAITFLKVTNAFGNGTARARDNPTFTARISQHNDESIPPHDQQLACESDALSVLGVPCVSSTTKTG